MIECPLWYFAMTLGEQKFVSKNEEITYKIKDPTRQQYFLGLSNDCKLRKTHETVPLALTLQSVLIDTVPVASLGPML